MIRLGLITLFFASVLAAQDGRIVYLGTYAEGVYAARFNPQTGALTSLGMVGATTRPSFLALHPNGRYLYAVNEVSNYGGEQAGSVTAFSIDPATGKLTKLNTVSSVGAGPCHLAVDSTGSLVIVANYGSGTVVSFPVKPDGSLGGPADYIQHAGSSKSPNQKGPHAHEIVISPDNYFVLVPDLGIDKIMIYRLDASEKMITPNSPPFAPLSPGSGPRHLAFGPNGMVVYAINELNSTISTFAYEKDGSMVEMDSVSTLPAGFKGTNAAAEIAVHPNGKFVYGSNRGNDSIAVFQVGDDGGLTLIQQEPSGGKTPRSFAIDPSGKFLLAANQASNSVVVHAIDPQTGRLTSTGQTLEVPSPVCVLFGK